jgi:polysaccharide export outer membrane protein
VSEPHTRCLAASFLLGVVSAGCSSVGPINDRAVLAQSADVHAPARLPDTWLARGETDYRIGPRDLLEIEVWELEKLNESKVIRARVAQGGDIVLPLIGAVRAAGATVEELHARIVEGYAQDYLVEPTVGVLVAEYEARRVTVLGSVQKPGTFSLQANSTTLIDALALAGGVGEDAGAEVYVVRANGGFEHAELTLGGDRPFDVGDGPVEATAARPGARMLKIDLRALVESGDLGLNCALQDGDVVHVRPAPTFFVTGMVRKGGAFPLHGDITVLKAIALAGGLDEHATPSATILIRRTETGEVRIPIDLTEVEAGSDRDLHLEAGDVLMIAEGGGRRFLRGIGDFFRGLFHVGYTL